MIESDASEPAAAARVAAAPRGAVAGRGWLAVVSLGAAFGACAQLLAARGRLLVADGVQAPGAGWPAVLSDGLWACALGAALTWVLVACVGRSAALRAGVLLAAGVGLPAAAVLGGAVATERMVTAMLGAALIVHLPTVRGSSAAAVAGAALAAAASASVCAQLQRLDLIAAVALGPLVTALLVAGSPDSARVGSPRGHGRLPWGGLAAIALTVAAVAAPTPLQAPVAAAVLVAVLGGLACRRAGLALGAAAVALALTWLEAPVAESRGVVISRAGDASLHYLRSDQELQLRVGGALLAAAGPDRDEEPLLLALVHAFARDGDVVTTLGRGTGRVAPALRDAARWVVDVRDAWPDAAALAPQASADGPVPPPGGAAAPRPAAPRALACVPDGARQLIAVCELPSAVTAHRTGEAFQRQLRRAVGDGVVLQPFALDRSDAALLAQLLRAATSVHGWNGVYAVGDAAVLVSAAARPTAWAGGRGLGERARWVLHRAHLGSPKDLERAFVGALSRPSANPSSPSAKPSPPSANPSRPSGELDLRSARAVLSQWVAPEAARPGPRSLLAWWSAQRGELRRAEEQVRALGDDPAGRSAAAAIAARFAPIGAPRAALQAALGLAGAEGAPLRDPQLQARCAHALDPTFFRSAPDVFGALERPTEAVGDLEDEHRVTVSERLARRCSGSDPLAVGLRARFASRCARALVDQLRLARLDADMALALRELADPFVLAEIARVLLPTGRWQELLTYWRSDLPMPRGLRARAATLSVEGRRRLAIALRSRAHPTGSDLLADLLLDDDLQVRALAGGALEQQVGDRIAFDPKWPRSRRLDAASQLRRRHNRRP